MRTTVALLVLSLAAPAHAGWRAAYDFSLAPAVQDHGVVPLQLSSISSFSPWQQGPMFSVGSTLDLIGETRLSRYGLGLTVPLGKDVQVGAQVQYLNRLDSGSYDASVGFEGHADWVVHRWEGTGLGLELRGGVAPFMDDVVWWSSAGFKVMFGNARGLQSTPDQD